MTEKVPASASLEAEDYSNVTFADFGLHPLIQKAIDEQGYTQPTPIQAKAIPVVSTGVDVMGAAQTGTGKTAGFSLPILNRLMPHASTSTSPARHPVRALMLAPTRELADQVANNVATYAKHTPLRSCVVYGGVDMNPQTAELRRGMEIVIATPGRLLDHVQQKSINLSQVQVLVLDEADRMLDMGFLPDLQRIINLLPKQRQNLLFSATFSPEIQKLAKSFMSQPTLIEVARRNATSDNIEQVLFSFEKEDHKRAAVGHLIKTQGLNQVIVFSNTKVGCARLARHLEREGITATAIHGDRTQSERTKSLEAFKAGEVVAMVATDVAARGLDITALPFVVNYDLPTTAEDYVHRIGRTGRAGAKGTAYSFFAKGNERVLKEIEKLIGKEIPKRDLEGFEPEAYKPAKREHDGERDRSERGERVGRFDRSTSRGQVRGQDRDQESRPPRRERRILEDTGPIRRDAEFERLRAKMAYMKVNDDIFNKPYEESGDVPESVRDEVKRQELLTKKLAPASAKSVGAKKADKPVAFLLGGSPKV